MKLLIYCFNLTSIYSLWQIFYCLLYFHRSVFDNLRNMHFRQPEKKKTGKNYRTCS